MQKKLIALAIASLSGAAFAQNVTVYGLIDGTFDVISVSGGQSGPPMTPTKGTPSFNRIQSNGSRLGFKGIENLGDGMSAFFQYESSAAFDAGGALGTTRDSFLGLKGNFGTIKLGNISGPNRDLAGKLDVVIHSDGIGDNSGILGKLGGRGSVFDTRYTNSIAYTTPKFSGIEVTVQYQANENKDDTPAAKINTSLYEAGLKYENGPIFIGVAYGRQNQNNDLVAPSSFTVGTDSEASEMRIGGMYDFGNATLRALYASTNAEGSLGDIDQDVWGIGGTYNVTANGKLLAQYYSADDIDGKLTGIPNLSDSGAQFWVFGYEHSLSKRTTLVAHYAHLKNDDRTGTVAGGATKGYNFGDGAIPAGFTGNEVKISGFSVGVSHSF